jgi:hypothetical protein
MHCFEARYKVNIDINTDATSVRLQQLLDLYHVQLIKLESGCENRLSAF